MKYLFRIILLCMLVVTTLQPLPVIVSAQADPWLDGWDYRQEYLITGATGAGTNYQVFINVTYDANMQVNFGDIRFTDNDATTLLDYWLEESYNSSFGLFWVEVADSLEISRSIYMYYGNSTVSTLSNGENTFLFYEDWSEQTVNASRWDVVVGDGTITYSSVNANHGYVMRAVGSSASSVYHIESDYDALAPTALVFRSYIELTTNVNHRRLRQGMGVFADSYVLIASNQGTNEIMISDDDSNLDNQVLGPSYFNSYWRFEVTRDGTNARGYANHTLIGTGSCDPDIISNPISMIYVRDTEYELYSDWIAGRKFVTGSEPVAIEGSWLDVHTMRLIFPVGWDPTAQFGYDMFFIVLGLIMIPVSTMYLVRGGRDEMNRDKLYYALILFFVGIGLVIGGVMP